MSQVTITEALAEIKLIDKRISTKREFIVQLLYRQERMRDPLEKQGGSVEAIARERQAIFDLGERKLAIRRSIQDANRATDVTIQGDTRTIADWLVWRREVAPTIQNILNGMRTSIQMARNEAIRKGVAVITTADVAKTDNDLLVNVDEAALAADCEKMDTILANLDGQLSLKNATILVEV